MHVARLVCTARSDEFDRMRRVTIAALQLSGHMETREQSEEQADSYGFVNSHPLHRLFAQAMARQPRTLRRSRQHLRKGSSPSCQSTASTPVLWDGVGHMRMWEGWCQVCVSLCVAMRACVCV